MPAPELPDDIAFSDLDRAVRARLRTLSKENAENVGLHLVMAGRLLDSDPELAYEHAQAAVRRAGRVDVVREAAGLAAYRTGRFAEALRELRTVRRLNGSSEHLAVMADCERGLGRPERALTLASSAEAEGLTPTEALELAIVVSGARVDLGEPEAAIAALQTSAVRGATGVVAVRVAQALAAAYEAAGRTDDARDALAGYTPAQLEEASGVVEEEDEVVVFDLDEDEHENGAFSSGVTEDAALSSGVTEDAALSSGVTEDAALSSGVTEDAALSSGVTEDAASSSGVTEQERDVESSEGDVEASQEHVAKDREAQDEAVAGETADAVEPGAEGDGDVADGDAGTSREDADEVQDRGDA